MAYKREEISILRNIERAVKKVDDNGKDTILSFAQGFAAGVKYTERQQAKKDDKPTEDKTDDEHTK